MKPILFIFLIIHLYFFAQAQDSINNIDKTEAKDTVAKTAKKLWLYFTPFTLGTKLNSNTILVGTHLSINILFKKHIVIAIKTDLISELQIFQNTENLWTAGAICSYYSKMKSGYLDVGIGLSYISGKYNTGIIESSGWLSTIYYMKSMKSVGVDFRFIRTFLFKKKNVGIGLMGNINKHISFANFGLTFKSNNFLNNAIKQLL
jgi:hypothetical protein